MKRGLSRAAMLLALLASVSAWAKPEVWFKVQMPKITLISALSRDETQEWAAELHQFEDGICFAFKIPTSSLSPLTVVAFRSDRELSAYKPLKNGRPIEISGYFARTEFSSVAGVSGELGPEDRRALYHEATHWITYSGDADLPLWLAEGLAEAYSTFSLKGDTFTFGTPLAGHVLLLNSGHWIPIPKLLASGPGAINYSDSDRTSAFYAESWLACHYLVFADTTGAGVSHIRNYLEARTSGDPDDAFRAAFGFSPGEFEALLRSYLAKGRYRLVRGRFVRPDAERAIHLDLATGVEVDLAKAELLLGAGRVSEARVRLMEILAVDPKSGGARKFLGLADLMDGNMVRMHGLASPDKWEVPGTVSEEFRESAINNLDEAVKLGETDMETVLLAAEAVTMGRNQKQDSSGIGDLGTARTRHAADLFELVANGHPTSLRAARGLGGILGALDQITDMDARAMRAAATSFPHDPLVATGAAIVDIQSVPRETGEKELNAVLQHSPPAPKDVADYARQILDGARKLDRMDRLNELLAHERYDEAISMLDAEIQNSSFGERPMFEGMKRLAACAKDMARLVDWINDGRIEEARPELKAMAANASLAPYNREAAQILQNVADVVKQDGTGRRP